MAMSFWKTNCILPKLFPPFNCLKNDTLASSYRLDGDISASVMQEQLFAKVKFNE